MTKQEILQDFEIKKVKTMRGTEGQQLACDLYYKGQLAAYFLDTADGGMANLDFVVPQAKKDIAGIMKERGVAEFMLKNGWNFMETTEKFTLLDEVQYIIDELFNAKQQAKLEASNKKRMEKDFEKNICYGVPGGGSYKMTGYKVPLADIAGRTGGKQALQDLIEKVKRERLQQGEVILNTNLEALGLTI